MNVKNQTEVNTNDSVQIQKRELRILKLLFRKHIHDMANKLQIIMGQQALAMREVNQSDKILYSLDKIKSVTQEISTEMQLVRKYYLTEQPQIVMPEPVAIDVLKLEIEKAFEKPAIVRKLNLIFENTHVSACPLIEFGSFAHYILLPLVMYVCKMTPEESTILVNFENSNSRIDLKIQYSCEDQSEIVKLCSEPHKFTEDEGAYSIVLDFMDANAAELSFASQPKALQNACFRISFSTEVSSN